jgi:hypothetical protein
MHFLIPSNLGGHAELFEKAHVQAPVASLCFLGLGALAGLVQSFTELHHKRHGRVIDGSKVRVQNGNIGGEFSPLPAQSSGHVPVT